MGLSSSPHLSCQSFCRKNHLERFAMQCSNIIVLMSMKKTIDKINDNDT